VVLMPAVVILPPRLAELDDDTVFIARNALALRNTLIASILDLQAISLPVATSDEAPVGLMLIGRRGAGRKLLAISEAIESTLRHE
jgi:aspartyl-tRNA(Asn)/glutamyl-tRNA(Gln) amidotransferase subunit A